MHRNESVPMVRIRTRGYRGYWMELWQVYAKEGRLRRVRPEPFGKLTYNYKVVTPTGELIEGKVYQPKPEWTTREQILDGLLEQLGILQIV